MGTRNLDGVLDRLCAGGDEKGLLGIAARRQRHQLFGQFNQGFVGQHLETGVRHPIQLRLDGLDDLRMRVTGVEYRDAAHEIEVAAPFDVPDLGALGTLDEHFVHLA